MSAIKDFSMLQQVLPFVVILPPLAYSLISLWCAASFFGRHGNGTGCALRPAGTGGGRCTPCLHGHTPPVTILKPVKGMDAGSYENFASFCRQEYPAFQIVFACASADDPVVPVIGRIMADFPDHDIELVVDGSIHGPNYKVCNLMNAWPQVKHDIVIVCDSDVRVEPYYLREVCAPFSDPGVGLVTSLYRTSGVHGAATAVEALGFTAEMVPNVMTALRLEGLSFALGASMAVRREALEKIGGFAALVDYLADDYQLGNKVWRAGYRLELSAYFVESVMHAESLASVLSRQLRWARTMRVSRPGGYFASGITQPFPAACLAVILSGLSVHGFVALLLLYGVRSLVALIFSRRFLGDGLLPRWLWLLPIRDGFGFVTWALAFLGRRVRWRGHLFRLVPGGRIEEIGG
jgi:ceramide glucosyltransferase